MNSNCNIHDDGVIVLNTPKSWKTFFEARHSIPERALKKTKELNTFSILTDIIVPSNQFSYFLKKTHSILQQSKIEYLLFGHLGDCHLHFHLIPTINKQSLAILAYEKIVEESTKLGGVYSAEHGTGKRKRSDFLKCYGPNAVKEVQIAKESIDPNFLLNRGNVIPYIPK